MLQYISRDERLVHAGVFIALEGHKGIVRKRVLGRYETRNDQSQQHNPPEALGQLTLDLSE